MYALSFSRPVCWLSLYSKTNQIRNKKSFIRMNWIKRVLGVITGIIIQNTSVHPYKSLTRRTLWRLARAPIFETAMQWHPIIQLGHNNQFWEPGKAQFYVCENQTLEYFHVFVMWKIFLCTPSNIWRYLWRHFCRCHRHHHARGIILHHFF